MENFIKELTIIDFLGILVPGSFLLLLFNQDYPIRDIWCDYFGTGSAADTVIFLIIGYLVGMLIHELGDLLEKLIWAFPWFNPRYYAAKKICVSIQNKAYDPIVPSGMPENNEAPTGSGHEKQKFFLQFLFSIAGAGIIFTSVLFFPILLRSDHHAVAITLYYTLFLIISISFYVTRKSIGNAEIAYVRKNSAIQVKIFGKVSAPKRQIFEGFYCIMRNLVLAIGLTNTYAIFLSDSPKFAQQAIRFYRNTSLLILYYIVSILMMIRCCHYVYLKYKYSYEDYLYLSNSEEQRLSCEKTALSKTDDKIK